MSKCAIRLSIILISIYSVLECIFAYLNIDISFFRLLFGHSMMTDIFLIAICMNQGKYHCIYMKYLCYNLLFVSAFDLIDSVFDIVPNASVYVYILSASWMVAILFTLVKAFNHFSIAIKLKHEIQRKRKRINK